MIPKVIHYIWFGNNPHTPIQNRCIESWSHYAPDYKIIRWDETNCDVNETVYTSQAYAEKKWAFVSDYFRFKILFLFGGFYIDTDVELHQSIEFLCDHKAFFAFEKQDFVNAGFMGSTPGHPIIKCILSSYKDDVFIFRNGNYNLLTIPLRTTKALRRIGLALNGSKQHLKSEVMIFPVNYLTLNMEDGHSVAEHHYEASWSDKKRAKSYKSYLIREYTKTGTVSIVRRWIKRGISRLKFMYVKFTCLRTNKI